MNHSSILDLGGNTAVDSVSCSHLGAGSPKLLADAYHPKRAKHCSDDSKHRIAQLRATLENDIKAITLTEDPGRPYALVYNDVERLCMAKHSEQALLAALIFSKIDVTLSEDVAPQISKCFSGYMLGLVENTAEATAFEFLKLCLAWFDLLKLLLQLFLHLDRSYLLHHPKHPCIAKYGKSRFVQCLMMRAGANDPSTKADDPLCRLVALLLAKTRGNRSNARLLTSLAQLIIDLDRLDPERRLLVNASLQTIVVEDYAVWQKEWLNDERTYVAELLHNIYEDSLLFSRCGKNDDFIAEVLVKLEWKYLLSEFNQYLEPSLPFLMLPGNHEHLRVIECLCELSMARYGVDSFKILLEIWGKYVQQRARSLTLGADIMTCILQLWEELLQVCEQVFAAEDFKFEVRSALTIALRNKDMSASLVASLSKYCDSAMKQASKTSELYTEIEENTLIIFKLMSDKLAFISVYERDLSKRILMSKSLNYTYEKQLVDAIVSVVGEADENLKMREMLRDYAKSKSLFSHLQLPFASLVDFSALVLEKKIWPEIPGFGTDIRLPQPLLLTLKEFEKHFSQKDEKHKVLDWNNYTLHQITLGTTFGHETKELQVNLLQAIVLMLFENNESLSIPQILESTQMDERLLRRVLASLNAEKYPVLKVNGDAISINEQFSDKAHKIKLPMGKEKETVLVENAKKLVQQERTSEARSALVRIMKVHKTLLVTELLGKAVEALQPRGTPSIQDLKNEVEHLILTEYIARDVTGTMLYYVP